MGTSVSSASRSAPNIAVPVAIPLHPNAGMGLDNNIAESITASLPDHMHTTPPLAVPANINSSLTKDVVSLKRSTSDCFFPWLACPSVLDPRAILILEDSTSVCRTSEQGVADRLGMLEAFLSDSQILHPKRQ